MKLSDFSRSALQPLAAGRDTVKWTAVAPVGSHTQDTYAFVAK
jgi:hypothetical protein